MFKTIKWNMDSAAVQRFRRTRKAIQENRKKNKAASSQAHKPASAKILTTEEYKILWDQYNVKKRS